MPEKIKVHIMCSFLFDDILAKTAFQTFFRCGMEFDNSFSYAIAFGFMPRFFDDDPHDRYLFEEEGDVTEIYFIMHGDWGVAFDSFAKSDHQGLQLEEEDKDMLGPRDMCERGILIA